MARGLATRFLPLNLRSWGQVGNSPKLRSLPTPGRPNSTAQQPVSFLRVYDAPDTSVPRSFRGSSLSLAQGHHAVVAAAHADRSCHPLALIAAILIRQLRSGRGDTHGSDFSATAA
jgi:hypothetical protein